MLPCAFWPLAEHISFGQNCFDASIGSVSVCICYSMPMDACFFNHSFPFHRIVGFYPCSGRATLIGEKAQATLRGRPRGRLGTDGSGKGCLRGRPRGRLGSGGLAPAARLRSSWSFRFNPGNRSNLIHQKFSDTPDVISQSCRHSWCATIPEMR